MPEIYTIQPLQAGENVIGKTVGVDGTASGTITRPNDTTTYAIGDQVGTGAITIPNVMRANGGTGFLVNVSLTRELSASPGSYRIYFYSIAPTTVISDNSPFSPAIANAPNKLGYVDIVMDYYTTSATTTVDGFHDGGHLFMRADTNSRNIYAVLIDQLGRTPVANEVYTLRISVDQN